MAGARFFILGIILILMSSVALAVPLVDVTEISDPLLLCGKPELYLDNLTVLDGCVVEGQEASFEACLTNEGGIAYFPRIYLGGTVLYQDRQGNIYNGTRCFEFKSKLYESPEIRVNVSYVMECKHITSTSYRLVYEGNVVSASIEAPEIHVCEIASNETFLEESEEIVPSYSVNLLSGSYSQICVESSSPGVFDYINKLFRRIIQLL